MSFKLLDVVTPKADLPDCGLRQGYIGTIVEVWEPGVFEVEFNTAGGYLVALLTLAADQLRAPTPQELKAPPPPDSEAHERGIRRAMRRTS